MTKKVSLCSMCPRSSYTFHKVNYYIKLLLGHTIIVIVIRILREAEKKDQPPKKKPFFAASEVIFKFQ